jgi:ABC-type antimicrobial peptide transport system ATPase subunit
MTEMKVKITLKNGETKILVLRSHSGELRKAFDFNTIDGWLVTDDILVRVDDISCVELLAKKYK